MTKDSPLTVAGAAAALGKFPRTAFPFDPQAREPARISRILPGEESIPPLRRAGPPLAAGNRFLRSPLLPRLHHCMSIGAARRCRLRTIVEYSEHHGAG